MLSLSLKRLKLIDNEMVDPFVWEFIAYNKFPTSIINKFHQIFFSTYFNHQPINFPTARAQAFLMDYT
jgi:hypothetical protein